MNDMDDNNDEAYERFLAFLASPPNNNAGKKEEEDEEKKKEAEDDLYLHGKKPEPKSELQQDRKSARNELMCRRSSFQRSSCTMNSLSTLNSLKQIAAVERPPRAGVHPDYPFENAVFQGGGAKVRIDHSNLHLYYIYIYMSGSIWI